MKKVALLLILITLFSKILGFAREITLSYFYGTSYISDAYIVSLTIPTVIFSFVATAIVTGYIPIYSRIESAFNEKKANQFTNNLMNCVLVIVILLYLFTIIFTEGLVLIFASGFDQEVIDLSVMFTRISIISIFFSTIVYVLKGFLEIKGSYVTSTLIGFPLNFFTIMFIVLSDVYSSIYLLPYGIVFAAFSQMLILYFFSRKHKYRYIMKIDIKDKHIRQMLIFSLPVAIGVSVNQINVIIDRTLASQVTSGGISALYYANQFNFFVQGVFVLTVTTIMFPLISKLANNNDILGMKKILDESVTGVLIFITPATIGIMFFSEQIINLLFGRGAFDQYSISLTSSALFYYSIGMLGFSLREIISRVFFAMQDTKTPVVNAVFSVIINIILSVILSRYMGISGLALATSIGSVITTILLFISLQRKIGRLNYKSNYSNFIKLLFSSLIMGILAKFLFVYVCTLFGDTLALIISIIFGAVIYFVLVLLLKVNEAKLLYNFIKQKIKIK